MSSQQTDDTPKSSPSATTSTVEPRRYSPPVVNVSTPGIPPMTPKPVSSAAVQAEENGLDLQTAAEIFAKSNIPMDSPRGIAILARVNEQAAKIKAEAKARAQAAVKSTQEAVFENVTPKAARQEKTEVKSKPTPLPNTWTLPKTYDPQHFGNPLPGPKPAWGLSMLKDAPNVSRGYRTKIYANEEDRKDDKGTERLVFVPQDQAPYTAMGLPWAQNEQSQARYVMSRHDGDSVAERAEMLAYMRAYREEVEKERASQAWYVEELERSKIRTARGAEEARKAGELEEAQITVQSPSVPQRQVIDLNEEEELFSDVHVRTTEHNANTSRTPEPEQYLEIPAPFQYIEDVDENVRTEEDDLVQVADWQIEADPASIPLPRTPAIPASTRQYIDPASVPLPKTPATPAFLYRTVDPAVSGFEQLSESVRNILTELPSVSSILTSIFDWIMGLYKIVFEPLLWTVKPTLLLAVFCTGAYFIFSILVHLYADSPYSVTHDGQTVTSTKSAAKKMTAKAHANSEQQSTTRGPVSAVTSSLMSIVNSSATSLTSLATLSLSTAWSLVTMIFSAAENTISWIASLFIGLTSISWDAITSIDVRFVYLLVVLALILASLLAVIRYRANLRAAWDKTCARCKYEYRVQKNGTLPFVAWDVAKLLLLIVWSIFMFAAGFGFRDFYDGFEKVTIVSSPC